jgi:hypothetical protein
MNSLSGHCCFGNGRIIRRAAEESRWTTIVGLLNGEGAKNEKLLVYRSVSDKDLMCHLSPLG